MTSVTPTPTPTLSRRLKDIARGILTILQLFGFTPLSLAHLRHLPRYFRDMSEFRRQGGKVGAVFPVLVDYASGSGVTGGHYFHQDLLVAQFVFEAAPATHIDVASRIDGFVAHVATFRPIDVLDIRPMPPTAHPNIRFVQADLMELQEDLRARYQSVSCLHALEHFGLGRYTDAIDIDGHRKGFAAIADLLAPGGLLYLAFPVGRPRVEFNAHRVFAPSEPLDWAGDRLTLQRFDYVDDRGDLHKQADVAAAAGLDYGCGIYTFRKA